jgi:hypothetical protein
LNDRWKLDPAFCNYLQNILRDSVPEIKRVASKAKSTCGLTNTSDWANTKRSVTKRQTVSGTSVRHTKGNQPKVDNVVSSTVQNHVMLRALLENSILHNLDMFLLRLRPVLGLLTKANRKTVNSGVKWCHTQRSVVQSPRTSSIRWLAMRKRNRVVSFVQPFLSRDDKASLSGQLERSRIILLRKIMVPLGPQVRRYSYVRPLKLVGPLRLIERSKQRLPLKPVGPLRLIERCEATLAIVLHQFDTRFVLY